MGGWPGYGDFLEAMADPQHPDHDDRSEWIGGRWDPEFFNLDGANEASRCRHPDGSAEPQPEVTGRQATRPDHILTNGPRLILTTVRKPLE